MDESNLLVIIILKPIHIYNNYSQRNIYMEEQTNKQRAYSYSSRCESAVTGSSNLLDMWLQAGLFFILFY